MTLRELQQIAESATPGPWGLGLSPGWYPIGPRDDPACAAAPMIHNARFIATFNPETVLQLLAVADNTTQLLAAIKDQHSNAGAFVRATTDMAMRLAITNTERAVASLENSAITRPAQD